METRFYNLKNLLEIKYGKNQKNIEEPHGKYPILGTGGVIGHTNQFLYDKPSVLIGRKGTIEKIQYIEQPFWTIDTLFYTIINEKLIIPKFLFYSLLMFIFYLIYCILFYFYEIFLIVFLFIVRLLFYFYYCLLLFFIFVLFVCLIKFISYYL